MLIHSQSGDYDDTADGELNHRELEPDHDGEQF